MIEAARSKRFTARNGGAAAAGGNCSGAATSDSEGALTLFSAREDASTQRGGYSVFTWLNLVCLDAPIVAVSWAWLFAQTSGAPFTWGRAAALFLTAWMIYLADRFGDGLTVTSHVATSARQRFCLRHRRGWILTMLLVAAVDVCVICTRLDPGELRLGFAVGVCAAVYLMVNQMTPSLWRVLPIKEVSIGFLFAAGTTVASAARLTSAMLPASLLFATLCAMNCICIAVWERGLDAAQHRLSIATAFPQVGRLMLPSLALLCLTSAMFAGQPLFLCLAGSAGLLALLHLSGERIAPDSRTALADLVLLSPLLVLGERALIACW